MIKRFLKRCAIAATILFVLVAAAGVVDDLDKGASLGQVVKNQAVFALWWPAFFMIAMPFVLVGSIRWKAGEFGWKLGRELTTGGHRDVGRAASAAARSTLSADEEEDSKPG